MEGKRNADNILVGKPEGKRTFARPGVDGKIIFKWILEKYGGVVWTGFFWLGIDIIG
jgi:hypothetical protein